MFPKNMFPKSIAADARMALVLLLVVFTVLTVLHWNRMGNSEGNSPDRRERGAIAVTSGEGDGETVQALARASGSFLDYLRSIDDNGLTDFTKKEAFYRDPEFWLSQRDMD
jgi:hypothetical protein